MKLSNRLKSIASLVTNEDIIADIGCDHAYLDIYLVKNKIIDKAYVSDVNYSALNNGFEMRKVAETLKGLIESVNLKKEALLQSEEDGAKEKLENVGLRGVDL